MLFSQQATSINLNGVDRNGDHSYFIINANRTLLYIILIILTFVVSQGQSMLITIKYPNCSRFHNELTIKCPTCQNISAITIPFPKGIYVDVYELSELHRNNKFPSFQTVPEVIDVEKPSQQEYPFRLTLLFGSIHYINVSIPIHLRYQLPSLNHVLF